MVSDETGNGEVVVVVTAFLLHCTSEVFVFCNAAQRTFVQEQLEKYAKIELPMTAFDKKRARKFNKTGPITPQTDTLLSRCIPVSFALVMADSQQPPPPNVNNDDDDDKQTTTTTEAATGKKRKRTNTITTAATAVSSVIDRVQLVESRHSHIAPTATKLAPGNMLGSSITEATADITSSSTTKPKGKRPGKAGGGGGVQHFSKRAKEMKMSQNWLHSTLVDAIESDRNLGLAMVSAMRMQRPSPPLCTKTHRDKLIWLQSASTTEDTQSHHHHEQEFINVIHTHCFMLPFAVIQSAMAANNNQSLPWLRLIRQGCYPSSLNNNNNNMLLPQETQEFHEINHTQGKVREDLAGCVVADKYAPRNQLQKEALKNIYEYFVCQPNPSMISKCTHAHQDPMHWLRSGLLVIPTGEGKTVVATTCVRDMYVRGIVHSVVIVINFRAAIKQWINSIKDIFGPKVMRKYIVIVNDENEDEKEEQGKEEGEEEETVDEDEDGDGDGNDTSSSRKPRYKLRIILATVQRLTVFAQQHMKLAAMIRSLEAAAENTGGDTCVVETRNDAFVKLLQPSLCQCGNTEECKTMIIMDEVHHIAASTYRYLFSQACPSMSVPFRLGLTADTQRKDGRGPLIDKLCGPIIYKRTLASMNRCLYQFDVMTIEKFMPPVGKAHTVFFNANSNLQISSGNSSTSTIAMTTATTAFDPFGIGIDSNNTAATTSLINKDETASALQLAVQNKKTFGGNFNGNANSLHIRRSTTAGNSMRALWLLKHCLHHQLFNVRNHMCCMLQVASIDHIAMIISVYNAIVRIRNLEPENVSFAYKWIDNIFIELPVLAGEGNKYRIPVVVANPNQLPQWQACVNAGASCSGGGSGNGAAAAWGAGKYAQSDAYVRSFKQQSSITVILATMQYAGEWYNNPNIDCLLFGDIPICPVQNCGRLRNFARGTVLYVHDRTMDRNSTRASDTTMKMIKHDIFPRMSKPEYIEVVSIRHYSAIDTELSRMHSMIKAGHDISITPQLATSSPATTTTTTIGRAATAVKKRPRAKKTATTTAVIKQQQQQEVKTEEEQSEPGEKKKKKPAVRRRKQPPPPPPLLDDATSPPPPIITDSTTAAPAEAQRKVGVKRKRPTAAAAAAAASTTSTKTNETEISEATTTAEPPLPPVKRRRAPKKIIITAAAAATVIIEESTQSEPAVTNDPFNLSL